MLKGLADNGMQFTFLPRYAGGLTAKYRGICWICSALPRKGINSGVSRSNIMAARLNDIAMRR